MICSFIPFLFSKSLYLFLFQGSGKPPVTPNKRKKSSGDASVEEQEEIASPKQKVKKQKKHKATVSFYHATNVANVQLKIVPPSLKETQPQASENLVLEYIVSNASELDTQPVVISFYFLFIN